MPLYKVTWQEEFTATVALSDETEVEEAVAQLARSGVYVVADVEELSG